MRGLGRGGGGRRVGADVQGGHRRPARLAEPRRSRQRLVALGATVQAFDPTVEAEAEPSRRPASGLHLRCRPLRCGDRGAGPRGAHRVGRVPVAGLLPGAAPPWPARGGRRPQPARPGRCAASASSTPGSGAGEPASWSPVAPGSSARTSATTWSSAATRWSASTTSRPVAANVAHLVDHDRFILVVADVSEKVELAEGQVDGVFNLASPASPPDYLALPLETLAVGSEGTRRVLELARAHGPGSCWRRPARCTATPRCTPRPSPTGATSTRSGPAASTTRPSGSPRR